MKAYLCGYYGMKNSGDDALLYASAWAAKHYLGADSASMSSPQPMEVPCFGLLPAKQSAQQGFRGQRRLQQYWSANGSDTVVFGGGSVLHSAQDISIKRHLMRLSKGKHHYACGVGLGPFENVAAEKVCAKFLRECSFVGLRDEKSFELAKTLAPDAKLQLTFDLAPLLLEQKNRMLRDVPRSGIAVSLCPVFEAGNAVDQSAMLKELAYALRTAQEQTGETIHLIDFNGHAQLGDRPIHLELRRLLGDSVHVKHIPYDPDPLSVLQRMLRFKVLIGMRLHASILAYLASTPVLNLEYHSKCGGWSEQIGHASCQRFSTKNLMGFELQTCLIAGLSRNFLMPEMPVSRAVALSKTNWSNDYVATKNSFYRTDSLIQQRSAHTGHLGLGAGAVSSCR
jgi:polysaccharide pyruvyl transferase WcaK-like protein